MNRKILFWPHRLLRNISRNVIKINKYTYKLIATMAIIITKQKFVAGLAAPQVGHNINIIMLNFKSEICLPSRTYIDEILILINPKIIKSSGYAIWNEECLSIPSESGFVKRQKYSLISFMNINGRLSIVTVSNFMSICIQHEIDHLKGILWIDYQTELKRVVVRKKMLEYK
jgi:peptide deformylase